MYPFADLRLIKILTCFNFPEQKVMVVLIVIALSLLGGVFTSDHYHVQNTVLALQNFRNLLIVIVLVLHNIGSLSGAGSC